MNITTARVIQITPEVHDRTGELNDVLGAVYEAHQRHGLYCSSRVCASSSPD
jgi:hypothetical protein